MHKWTLPCSPEHLRQSWKKSGMPGHAHMESSNTSVLPYIYIYGITLQHPKSHLNFINRAIPLAESILAISRGPEFPRTFVFFVEI